MQAPVHNLFSVWLLYKLIFILALLSSAITSTETLNTHHMYLSTLGNAEKMKEKKSEAVQTIRVLTETLIHCIYAVCIYKLFI